MDQRQRQFTRHRVILKVNVRTRQGWVPCTTVDVARGGIFVKSEARFDLQRVVQMQLCLPDGEPVSVLGQVRRNVMQVNASSAVPGIGVEFFKMGAGEQARWDLFVMKLSEADKQAMADAISFKPNQAKPTSASVRPSSESLKPGRAARSHVSSRAAPPRTPAQRRHGAGGPTKSRHPLSRAGGIAPHHDAHDAQSATIIRIRPRSADRLRRLIEHRLREESLTLSTTERIETGQQVELVLVHHKTDAEFVVEATCINVSLGGPPGRQTVTLSFPPVSDRTTGELERFLRTGMRDSKQMERQQRALLDSRRRRVERNPKDPQALVELGWAVLAVQERPEEAAEVFLQALSLAEKRQDIHHALGICYSLCRREELAYQFIRSSLMLQKSNVSGRPNIANEGDKRATLRDEIGAQRNHRRQ